MDRVYSDMYQVSGVDSKHMHCIYDAWVQHMFHLQEFDRVKVAESSEMLSWSVYCAIRTGAGNGKGHTWGGIVPALFQAMSGLYGYSVRVQCRVWTKECYLSDLASGQSGIDARHVRYARWLVQDGDFGEEVRTIMLEPAVYLLLNRNHAVFSETVPEKGFPVMALRVYRE